MYYDITKTFEFNCKTPPAIEYKIATRSKAPQEQWPTFLGYKIASRIGLAPCGGSTSVGIKILSQAGVDVFTYKTMRSYYHESHPLPNMVHVQNTPLTKDDMGKQIKKLNSPTDPVAMTTSFGNPAFAPEWTRQDIAKARSYLSDAQVLIVSVYGKTDEEFIAAAQLAQEAGAQIIEANVSCPNVSDLPLYKKPEKLFQLCTKLKATTDLPLLIKVGLFDTKEQMEEVFCIAAQAGINGISGINGIPMEVVDYNGKSVFADSRTVAGVGGAPIFELAKKFVREAKEIIQKNNLDLKLIAMGGVTKPEDFQTLLDLGADIAMSATGLMYNPLLAMEYHQQSNMLKKAQ